MDSTAHNDLLLQHAHDLIEEQENEWLESLREEFYYPEILLREQYEESLRYEELEVERIRNIENN